MPRFWIYARGPMVLGVFRSLYLITVPTWERIDAVFWFTHNHETIRNFAGSWSYDPIRIIFFHIQKGFTFFQSWVLLTSVLRDELVRYLHGVLYEVASLAHFRNWVISWFLILRRLKIPHFLYGLVRDSHIRVVVSVHWRIRKQPFIRALSLLQNYILAKPLPHHRQREWGPANVGLLVRYWIQSFKLWPRVQHLPHLVEQVLIILQLLNALVSF